MALSFTRHQGLPHPQWEHFAPDAAEAGCATAEKTSWRPFAEEWLVTLAKAISEEAMVFAAPRVLLLGAPADEPLIGFAERTISHLDHVLEGVGAFEPGAPCAIIVFNDHERYYDYVDYFHREDGAYGASAGMFIDGGYPHIAVGPGEPWLRKAVIAHELTHNALHHLAIPRWLNEGMAQLVEEQLAGAARGQLDREMIERHDAYWREHGLETFWSGEAFGANDERQELAYHLALALTRSIISHERKSAADFVRTAHRYDCGECAARHFLGKSLSNYVSAILGPGAWTPSTGHEC
jgi:hypothetical protein